MRAVAMLACPEPFLHLRDVRLVVEHVGRRGGAQRMRADLETQRRWVSPHQLVDPVLRDGALQSAGAVVAYRAEQRTGVRPSLLSVFGHATPLTGLWVTAFRSQRCSNSDASDERRCRTVLPPPATAHRFVAPGDDVGARHRAELVRPGDDS